MGEEELEDKVLMARKEQKKIGPSPQKKKNDAGPSKNNKKHGDNE